MTATAPLANIITLGVYDLNRERDFYRKMEWPLVFDSDDFVAFELQGSVLTLFPVDKLATDSRAQPEGERGGIRFAVIISADSADQVDEIADRAVRAGGSLSKVPTDAEFFDGRDAYFADPERNYWEIAYAPPDNPVAVAARRAAGLA